MKEYYSLSDQMADHLAIRDEANLCRQVERETLDAAAEVCLLLMVEIGAAPGSSIHSALSLAEDRIRRISV